MSAETVIHPPSTEGDISSLAEHKWDIPCDFPSHHAWGTRAAAWAVWYRSPKSCGCAGPGFRYFCAGCWERRCKPGLRIRCMECDALAPSQFADILRVEPLS